MQSTIALSTGEAEYGALSQAMRTVIPIREAIIDLVNIVRVNGEAGNVFGPYAELSNFRTISHEDNSSALSLTVNQLITSRTKHWCVVPLLLELYQ